LKKVLAHASELMQIVGMNTTKKWQFVNRSVRAGNLPADNYSGFKIGDLVWTPNGRSGKVVDVRFMNTPSSALYYVDVEDLDGDVRDYYPETLKKV
jgi:hypothetical protein